VKYDAVPRLGDRLRRGRRDQRAVLDVGHRHVVLRVVQALPHVEGVVGVDDDLTTQDEAHPLVARLGVDQPPIRRVRHG